MQKQHGKRGRRPRNEPPKVWHNPDVVVGPPRVREENRAAKEKAEATPLPGLVDGAPPHAPSSRPGSHGNGRPQKIIAASSPTTDPKVLERERLLAKLVAAEGRPAITRAADAVVTAGFELPDEQTVHLQMLEHSREEYVQTAIEKLARLLAIEPCKRHTVLESRLRRLEEFAEEQTTRTVARELRRQVTGRARDGSDTPRPPLVEPE